MLALALIALLAGQANLPENKLDLCWVYVGSPLAWKSPPRSLKLGYQYSEGASVAIIYPSGKLVVISATLHRDAKTRRISISRGDDMVVFRGTWEIQSEGFLRAKLSWASGGISMGKEAKRQLHEERWALNGKAPRRLAAIVQSPHIKYVPFMDFEDLDFLQNSIRDEKDTAHNQNKSAPGGGQTEQYGAENRSLCRDLLPAYACDTRE